MERLKGLKSMIDTCGTAPRLEDMPRRGLAEKWLDGPTGAHVIEEVHTPLNFEYITATTGTTAFQNLVGVTAPELPLRVAAATAALEGAGIGRGSTLLVTYPPLVSVFSRRGLEENGVRPQFLEASSRDALVYALCSLRPRAVIGESAFLRLSLLDAQRAGLADLLPHGLILLAAGTPLDPELPEMARSLVGGRVFDLYGCQEFGWLTLNGLPLRPDIILVPDGREHALIVGGLPTGDSFPVVEGGHVCGGAGSIITPSRRRSSELEVTVLATTATGRETVERLARGILRIKARIVRVADHVRLGAPATVLALGRPQEREPVAVLEGKTQMFDALLQAQMEYQARAKADPAWVKSR